MPRTKGPYTIPPDPTPLTRCFVNRQGEVRAGWRLVFYVILMVIPARGIGALLAYLKLLPTQTGTMTPGVQMLNEGVIAIVIVGAAVIMARLERRPFGMYGLPRSDRAGKQVMAGAVWGLVLVSAIIGSIALLHGYDFGQLALTEPAILEYGGAWLVGFALVGLVEEFMFRGYSQFTLASGIGFWPAATLLSAAFGAAHLGNPGERGIGALMVFVTAMFFCLTLRRTGSLWFAVGAHATFDWGETFLYSVPNSGLVATGHLSASSLHGATWLTGGTVGPEGSVFSFAGLGLSIVLFALFYPRTASVTSERAG